MKRIGALLLGSFVFLCALFAAGCTDTTELQQQIDELKASQAEIQALKDEINSLKSQIASNNQELQDQLNQATAKLATLEGKINGEPIEYLNLGDTASFVSNGIKIFEITTTHAHINSLKLRFIRFNLKTDNFSENLEFVNLTAFLSGIDVNENEIIVANKQLLINTDNDFPGEYLFAFNGNNIEELISNPCTLYLFSGANLFAAYQITFELS